MEENTLEERLRTGPRLSGEQAISVIRQCAEELDRRGIRPGHPTPSDILIADAGGSIRVRVANELAAWPKKENDSATLPTAGAAEYLSPEEILGSAKNLQSDEFSLGVIAYQLLCGRLPFGGGNLSLLFYEMCTGDPVAAHLANPELNGETSHVLEQAMAKDPSKRYPSCSEFAKALAQALPKPAPPVERVLPAVPVMAAAAVPVLPPARRRRMDYEDDNKSGKTSSPMSAVQKTGLVVALILLLLGLAAWLFGWHGKPNLPVQVMDPQASPAAPPPTSAQQPAANSPATTPTPAPAQSLPQSAPQAAPEQPAAIERNRPEEPRVATQKPTAEEPSATGDASVDFLSVPSGAQMAIDDHNYCTAPCTLTLSAGRHVLRANMPGFSPAQRIFHTPEETSVMVELGESVGTLIVTSVPSGASVMVDGKDVGRTPLTLHVKPGQHRLDGFLGAEQRQQMVIVQPDAIQSATFNLH